MVMSEALKPCPFCGATPLSDHSWVHDCCCGECGPFRSDAIECYCGAKADSVKEWNTRTSAPEEQEP